MTNEDVIRREDAINLVHNLAQPCDDNYDWDISADDMIDGIKDLPSVTPQRSKGKWIQTKDECDGTNFYDFLFECTECGKEQSFKSNYCPNCGADMESEDAEWQ